MLNYNELFKEHGIITFAGYSCKDDPLADFELDNGEDLIQYCEVNRIKSVILNEIYKEKQTEKIDIDTLRSKLTDYFNKQLNDYAFAYLPSYYKKITKDFYSPVLAEAIALLEEKVSVYDSSFWSANEDYSCEEELTLAEAWAIDQGATVHAILYMDDSDNDGQETARSILAGCAKKIRDGLNKRKEIAYEENRRLEREDYDKEREDIIGQIKQIIEESEEIQFLRTQKSRNEFADIIHSDWKTGKGYNWLTKTDVRSLVDYQYYSLTKE